MPLELPCISGTAFVGGQVLHSGRIDRSRGHFRTRISDYALVYVIAGKVAYADESGREATLRAGDLILRFPGFEQTYQPSPGCNWSEQFLTFRGPFFDLWEQLGLLERSRPLWRLDPVRTWTKRMAAITAAHPDATADEALDMITRLQGLLAAMRREQGAPPRAHANDAWVRRARRAIEQEVGRAPDWEGIAGDFGLGYEGFRKRFRRLAGESPGRHFLQARMRQATWLLERSQLTSREVAETCGFSDEFHFSKQFKRMMGIPPQEYRRRTPG